jgi:hypothetical protein
MVLVITYGSTDYTLSVVEGLDISLGYEGGPEAKYGSRLKSHSVGSKSASFTITRWYYADATQEDLLLDLFGGELQFTLKGSLQTNAGVAIANTSIQLNNCLIYRWRPRTGGADDIMGEEASGYALDWTITVEPTA